MNRLLPATGNSFARAMVTRGWLKEPMLASTSPRVQVLVRAFSRYGGRSGRGGREREAGDEEGREGQEAAPPREATWADREGPRGPRRQDRDRGSYEPRSDRAPRGGRDFDRPRREFDGPRRDFDGPRKEFDGPRRDFDGPRKEFNGPRREFDGPRGGRDFSNRGARDGDGPRGGRSFDGPRRDFDAPRGGRDFDGPRGGRREYDRDTPRRDPEPAETNEDLESFTPRPRGPRRSASPDDSAAAAAPAAAPARDLGYWLQQRDAEAEAQGDSDEDEYEAERDRDRRGGGGGAFGRRGPSDPSTRPGGIKYTRERRREAGGPPTLKETLQGEVLYGVAPVLAALQAGRRTVTRLLVQDSVQGGGSDARKDTKAIALAVRLAEERGAEVVEVSKHDLNMLTDNRPHQGLALDCSSLDLKPMDEPPAAATKRQGAKFPVWLALDEVTDPQNLGAIIRSAYFLGADGVLCCAKNSAPLSAVASKASAGALETVRIHDVYNLPRYLEACAAAGWKVLGAEAGESSVDVRSMVLDAPTVLVMGSEGFGLRVNVRRACTGFLKIPAGLGAEDLKESGVDSLNVSVSAGILLHELLKPSA